MSDKRRIRRPSHQTVVSYLALFLVVAGGTAFAAATIDSGDVINGALKSVDLKNNAGVKGADVPANNLRAADFGSGARASIGGADVANNGLGGSQVNEASLSASNVVARLGGIVGQPLAAGAPIPFTNNTYTQAAEEYNEFIAGGQVTWSAACTQPRNATVYLLIDNPLLAIDTILGIGTVSDTGAGAVSKHIDIQAFFGPGQGMRQPPQAAATPHQLFLYGGASCNAGAGVTLDSLLVDVVGHQ